MLRIKHDFSKSARVKSGKSEVFRSILDTYLAVASRGECDATVVSNLTGRCRAAESNYLNQLSHMVWLNKRRVSKTIAFRSNANRLEKTMQLPRMGKFKIG